MNVDRVDAIAIAVRRAVTEIVRAVDPAAIAGGSQASGANRWRTCNWRTCRSSAGAATPESRPPRAGGPIMPPLMPPTQPAWKEPKPEADNRNPQPEPAPAERSRKSKE